MRSIGSWAFGLVFFNGKIHIRLPLEIHNAVKIWLSKIQIWWSDLPIPSQEISIPTLELFNQISPTGEISETIPWVIVIVPLLINLKNRINSKFGICTRAEPGEKISAGIVRVKE